MFAEPLLNFSQTLGEDTMNSSVVSILLSTSWNQEQEDDSRNSID